jgi:hypothetical protein
MAKAMKTTFGLAMVFSEHAASKFACLKELAL